MSPSSEGGAILPCPAGTNPISGGFHYDGIGEVFISRRQGSGWQAAARNYLGAGTPDATLTIYATCAPVTIGTAAATTNRLRSTAP